MGLLKKNNRGKTAPSNNRRLRVQPSNRRLSADATVQEELKAPKRRDGHWFGIRKRWLRGGIFVTLGFVLAAVGWAFLFRVDTHSIGVLAALLLGALFLALLFVIGIYFVRSIADRIREITFAAHRISEGSYGVQLTKSHDDEVGELTDAINHMSMRLGHAETLKTEFISSVSHELRTPLTAITGWGETLLYDESLSIDSRRGLEIILGEARRLSKLVEELLEFTRMEDGRFTLNIQQIDIAKELEDTIFTYREHLRRDGIELTYTPYDREDIPTIPGDPERLRQVFYNILDNAAKHGRDGGKIAVTMDISDGHVVTAIRDWGPGIPHDEIDHVKMKFYKGANSKERGSGIGLAVCEEIIHYHNGAFEIENAEDRGLSVTVRLPVA